jgi:2-oxo-4-hydroxy-4-carboxy-5-ureidoimidazoline decarboxylase
MPKTPDQVLNHATADDARAMLLKCCGSTRWVDAMLRARPFASTDQLQIVADAAFATLEPADWLEAFTHHPKIGDVENLRKKFATTANWAANEQSGVNAADEKTIQDLAAGNTAYEQKFGFIFIICATGKSAQEMLAALNARLPHERAEEIRLAGAEQQKITHLRLAKLGA